MNIKQTVSNKLITKLSISFFTIILIAGIGYIFITSYNYKRYFEETTQKLNANIASHLINEKFQDEGPFMPNGEINKPLFGDIMHDMMAVNQSIEVYLLGLDGTVLYSVVLDHDTGKPEPVVSIEPIEKFIQSEEPIYVLGEDPRNPADKKIFSAAKFDWKGQEGYIYIILSGNQYEDALASLWSSYFLRVGFWASILTIIVAGLLGVLSVWYLTKNLRQIIFHANRFKEGDLDSRIPNASHTDLNVVATTFNKMADTIVSNIEKLESVENFRKELIANVSHDLRTPLAIMSGYIETLQMKNTKLSDEDRVQYLQIVEDSIGKLSALVNQLFEYSKFESNQIVPEKEPFQLAELASDIHASYQVIAQQKGIELVLKIDKSIPMVFADISLVERAIQNLLDNALKFTDPGGKVTISLNSDHEKAFISIIDSGEGISEEDQAMIFERYSQSGKSGAKLGQGLGLAIVRKIIEIHDSTIKVISKPKLGTTFQFGLHLYTGHLMKESGLI